MDTQITLTTNWLNNGTAKPIDTDLGGTTAGVCGNRFKVTLADHPYYVYSNYDYYHPRPIKLTVFEIERLREAAKADKALKDILIKFTSQIEVSFDFE